MHPTEFIIDFNMRNLSISFFFNAGILRNSKSKDLAVSDYFLELEKCELEAKADRFLNPDHIELRLTPSRSKGLDMNDKTVGELPLIKSILLAVTENPEQFWKLIYPMFKEKKPLVNDNRTGLESLASYRTFITNHDKKAISKRQEKSSVAIESKIPVVKANVSEDLLTASECEASENLLKKESIVRKTAKVGPQVPAKLSRNQKPDQSVYDDVSRDEEALSPLSKFMTQKRTNRLSQSQSQVIENTETTIPDNSTAAEIKKPLVKKVATPGAKKNPPKPRGRAKTLRRNSIDIDDDIKEAFGDEVHEPLPPLVAQRKQRSPQQKVAATNKKAHKKTAKKDTTFETSDGDMETTYVTTIAEKKLNAANKKKPAIKTVQARRSARFKIEQSDKLAQRVVQKKAPKAPKHVVSDFDATLNGSKMTTAPVKEPQMDVMATRLAKKRVSFDDNIQHTKRSRTTSIESAKHLQEATRKQKSPRSTNMGSKKSMTRSTAKEKHLAVAAETPPLTFVKPATAEKKDIPSETTCFIVQLQRVVFEKNIKFELHVNLEQHSSIVINKESVQSILNISDLQFSSIMNLLDIVERYDYTIGDKVGKSGENFMTHQLDLFFSTQIRFKIFQLHINGEVNCVGGNKNNQ
jgi:hypothetical protein